tara:strand:- start:8894 stop:11437 length:2544 start_codon:yes stop_codon:yes gene_type:complete
MDQKKVEEQLKRIKKLYAELGEENPYRGVDPSKIAASVKEMDKMKAVLDGVQSRVDNLDQTFTSLQQQLQATIREIAKAPTPIKQMQSGFKGVLTQVKKLSYEEEGIDRLNIKQLKNIQKISKQRIFDASVAAKQVTEEYHAQQNLLTTNKQRLDYYKSQSDAVKAALAFLQEEDETVRSINDKIKKRIEFEENVNKNLGLGGNIIKSIGTSLDKLGMGGLSKTLGLEDAQEEMTATAERVENLDKKLKAADKTGFSPMTKQQMVLKKGFSSMKGSILKNLKDPLVISTFLINEMVAALKSSDKATGELAKSMNMSYNEASSMRNELQSVANLSGDVLINSKGLQESLMAINAELGTNVMLNSENLKTYTLLREASGLTMEDQKGIVSLTNATKGNAEGITKEFLGAAKASATKNKSVLNEKTLLKEISNISAATTLSLGKDAGLIGETVATVKALGMEMSKVDAIASSLLEFESSIESELQAELLLNKDINLEKARQAALNNDFATVAKEIAEQAGSSAEFSEMNRIQQEALAKAVGMNREELAKTLFVQEQIGNVSEEEANLREQRINKLQAEGLSNEQIKQKLGEESFESLKNQASVQERLTKSVEKLREVFMSLAGPVMQLVSPIIDLLIPALAAVSFILEPIFTGFRGMSEILTGSFETLTGWETVLGSILTIWAGITAYTKISAGITAGKVIMEGVIAAQKKLQSREDLKGLAFGKSKIVQLAAQAALWALSNPFKAILGLAAAATIGAVAMNYSKVGDLKIDPNGGPIVSSPKEGGIFQGTKNDELRMGPTKALNASTNSGGTTVVQAPENKETNSLLAELVNQYKKQPQLSAVGLYEIQ